MREFFLCLTAAAVLLIPAGVCLWAARRGRGRRAPKIPSPDREQERRELDRLAARAGMCNFYLYDGSPQRDPREIARDCYERKVR